MAKQNGLGWTTATIDDASGTPVALVNGFTNLAIATPRGVQDVTGLDKSAIERILGLADMSVTLAGPVDFGAGGTHSVFSTVPSTSVPRTVALGIGGKSLTAELLFTDYPLTRAASGEFTFTVPGVLASGVVPTWA